MCQEKKKKGYYLLYLNFLPQLVNCSCQNPCLAMVRFQQGQIVYICCSLYSF